MTLNKVMLIGNVGRDPEVRHLEGGSVTASFTIATTERYKDKTGENKEVTEWHNIVCWRNLAELADKYIKKGTQLYIEGKIRTRSWTDRDGNTRYTTEIQADSIQLLGRKGDNPASSYTSAAKPYSPSMAPAQPQSPVPPSNANEGTFTSAVNSSDAGFDGSDEDDLPF